MDSCRGLVLNESPGATFLFLFRVAPILKSNRRLVYSPTFYGHQRPSGAKAIRQPLVAVVDDDESVRESLPDLLKGFGFAVVAFSSADEFLVSDSVNRTICLVLDIAMPGMSGLDLQKELTSRGYKIPIVFITAQRDEFVRKQVLEQGAVDILLKPFSDIALREALSKAMGGN
jgi:FixJ family two-component response regulator